MDVRSFFKGLLGFAVFVGFAWLVWSKPVPCSETVKDLKAVEVSLVIKQMERKGKTFLAKGHEPRTGKSVEYHPNGGPWFSYLYHELEVGDTLTKALGQTVFVIRKAGRITSVPYVCDAEDINVKRPKVLEQTR